MLATQTLPALTRAFNLFGLGRVSTSNGYQPLLEAVLILCRADPSRSLYEALPLRRRSLLRCFRHVFSSKGARIHSLHR